MAGVRVERVRLASGDSVRVLFAGPDRDTAVVLVHGWGGCVYTFAEMIPALAKAAHRVIALDLPGFGLSDKPADPSRYSTRALADAVSEVVGAAGARRYALVAHSFGGAIALDLAARRDPALERLVLINAVGLGRVPAFLFMKVLSPPLVDRLVPGFLTRDVVRVVLRLAFGTRQRPTERDVDEYWAPTQFDELVRSCRECIHRADWSRVAATRLRSLRIPVLVITGNRDLLVRGAASRAALIPGVRRVAVREGGHLVLQECAGRTNAEVLRFLPPADAS